MKSLPFVFLTAIAMLPPAAGCGADESPLQAPAPGRPAVPACEPGQAGCEQDEHGGHEGGGEEADHGDEITLSEDALRVSDIRVGKAERRAITGGGAFPAEIRFEPSGTAHVKPLGIGRLASVAVKLGDVVTAGQVLATILSSDVADIEGQLAQARARLSGATAELRRNEQLVKEGVGAARGVVDARAAVATIRAEVGGLQRRLDALGAQASGALELHAPIDGVVASIHAVVGEFASADEAVFTIIDPSRVYVEAFVPELEIGRVAVDAPVIVRTHAYEDLALEGHVATIAPSLDETTRSLPVRIMLTTGDVRLKGGMFALVELSREGGRPLVVPADGVATLEGRDVVFVPNDEPRTFVPKPVRLGRRSSGYVEVLDGLAEGDAVVTHGGFVLKSALSKGSISEGHEH